MFFKKNGINVGGKFAKIMKILDKIDDLKSQGVIYETKTFSVLVLELIGNNSRTRTLNVSVS